MSCDVGSRPFSLVYISQSSTGGGLLVCGLANTALVAKKFIVKFG